MLSTVKGAFSFTKQPWCRPEGEAAYDWRVRISSGGLALLTRSLVGILQNPVANLYLLLSDLFTFAETGCEGTRPLAAALAAARVTVLVTSLVTASSHRFPEDVGRPTITQR